MHNLTDKTCPLMGSTCLLNGCTFFNVRLDGCEFSILNYNLYQLKEHIRAQLNRADGVPESRPVSDFEKPTGSRFPRANR